MTRKRKFKRNFANESTEEEALAHAEHLSDTQKLADNADIVEMMNSSSGRRVFRRILQECGVMTNPFYGEETHATAFFEGRRSIGLSIIDFLQVQPNFYIMLQKEGIEDALVKEQQQLKVSRDTPDDDDEELL